MYISNDGVKLYTKLEKPKNFDGKCPLVIIIHGLTGHMEERHLVAVSQCFNEMGLATLRVDMYGHGKSEGTFREHTLYKWVTNALAVIDYARSLDFVTTLYLCGHSQGGLTSVLAAGMKHENIDGLILLSPACMIPDGARKGTLLGMQFDPDHLPEEVPIWETDVLDSNYFRTAQTIHVEEAIDRYHGPVLIVQGDIDEPDLIRSAKDASARYKNCTFSMITGDTHCYDNHLDLVLDSIQKWMQKH